MSAATRPTHNGLRVIVSAWQVGDAVEVQSLACMKRHVFMGNTGGSVGGIPQLLTEALVMY